MGVKRLRDGRWIVYGRKGYFPGDLNKTREYFGREESAEEKAEKRDKELKALAQANKVNVAKKAASLLVYQLCRAYKESMSAQMQESTKNAFWYKLKILVQALGHIEASKLEEKHLAKYVNDRLTAGKKRSTARRELEDLKAIFAWGTRKGYLVNNPIANFELPAHDHEIIMPPTDDEIRAIIKHASPHLIRAIYLSTLTGLRPGVQELLFMEWHQINFENQTITVISAKKGGLPLRQVPIHPILLEKLLKWKTEDGPDQQYVIHYRGKPIESLKTAWKRAKARAGIARRLRPYDFRHKFASGVLENGGDLKAVSEILGHTNPDTTMRFYQHVSRQLHRKSVEKLDVDF